MDTENEIRTTILWLCLIIVVQATVVIGMLIYKLFIHLETNRNVRESNKLTRESNELISVYLEKQGLINIAVMEIQTHQSTLDKRILEEIKETLLSIKQSTPAIAETAAVKVVEAITPSSDGSIPTLKKG